MVRSYEEENARLSQLPRAERFAQLIDFPTEHTFKVIGRQDGFSEAVRRMLESNGYQAIPLGERASGTGRYVSLTFTLMVPSAEELDRIYISLERLPGLAYLL